MTKSSTPDTEFKANAAPHIEHHYVAANGITLHVADAGAGRPILFLHGFPDFWGAWAPIMARLSKNYRVIAPDLRGYGDSSRPLNVADYRPERLVSDGLGLLEELELRDVILVGHDWGGILAFWMAMVDPTRISHLVALNTAHPFVLQDMIWDDPAQRAASQYIAMLKSKEADHRFNAERAEDIAAEWLGGPLEKGQISQAEYARYLELWSDPMAWPCMLNWYRAAPFDVPAIGAPAPEARWTANQNYTIKCPVTVIWGDADPVFSRTLPDALTPFVPSLKIHRLAHAGHVPHRDEPDFCAEKIGEVAALKNQIY